MLRRSAVVSQFHPEVYKFFVAELLRNSAEQCCEVQLDTGCEHFGLEDFRASGVEGPVLVALVQITLEW